VVFSFHSSNKSTPLALNPIRLRGSDFLVNSSSTFLNWDSSFKYSSCHCKHASAAFPATALRAFRDFLVGALREATNAETLVRGT